MVLKEHLTKLKQLLAVEDLRGYKSTKSVVIVDNVLIAQYDPKKDVINGAGVLQPLSTLQPNKRNEMTAIKFCGKTHIKRTLNVLN